MNNIKTFLNNIDTYIFDDNKKNKKYFRVVKPLNNDNFIKAIEKKIKYLYGTVYRYKFNNYTYNFIPNRKYYIIINNKEFYFNYILIIKK